MEKFKMVTYRREYGEGKSPVVEGAKKVLRYKEMVFLACISFLLGRATILGGLAPFGVAFFSYFCLKDRKFFYLGLSTFLGMMTLPAKAGVWKYAIMLLLSVPVFSFVRKKIQQKPFYMAGISSMMLFVSGMIFSFKTDFYLYDLFLLGFESIVVFVFIYTLSYSVPVFIQKNNRKTLSNEELVCTAILAAVVVSGFSDMALFGYSIKRICGILLTVIFAYYGGTGIGTSIGLTIGLISSMSGLEMPIIVAGYGFSGLLAGVFRELGKLGSGIGMFLGFVIMNFYMSASAGTTVPFQEMVAAAVIFFLMPKSVSNYMEKFIRSSSGFNQAEQTYSERVKGILSQTLKRYGNAFSELADTYGNIAEKDRVVDQNEIAKIVDQVATKVCSTCGMCRSCWRTNFYNTYQGIVDVLLRLESYEKINLENVPEVFRKRCIKINSLINAIEDSYHIYHIHYEWYQKLFENRQLIAEQFKGISETLAGLAAEVDKKICFDTQAEEDIYVAMDKAGISVEKVTVLEKENGQLEIEIGRKPCYSRLQCEEKIIPIVSQALGRPLVRKNRHCKMEKNSGICSFVLVEPQTYQVATGTARISKDQRGISGDSFSIVDLPDGKVMIALSDGMGTGEKAAQASSATVAVLEQLMEAGFHKELAIKTVNSILVTKSSEEIFSTMDLSIIDLYTGKVEFVKIGSAPSFIKRRNGTVETIQSTSLPIGILDKVDIESFGKRLDNGDFLIMVSDGVLDAEPKKVNREEWIVAALEGLQDRNPQSIADRLLDMAIEKYGNEIKDDMTVLVAKIWETRSGKK